MKSILEEELITYSKNVEFLKSIQGNILNKHGGGNELFIFLRFNQNPKEVRSLFANLPVKSAWDQYQSSNSYKKKGKLETFLGCYLSYSGYKYLQINDSEIPDDDAFRNGMASRSLGDPPITEWENLYQENIHAIILLIDDNKADLNVELKKLETDWGSSIAGIQWGKKLQNQHGQTIEHFGYVDGISQPIFFKDQYGKISTNDFWDPKAKLCLALVKEPKSNSFGSYLVFRKLEQNVKAFKQAEEKLAHQLGFIGETEEVAGALIIGRFENGLPVVKYGSVPDPEAVFKDNDFDYSIDPDGSRCPYHAHIRKTNPRGDSTRSFGSSFEDERDHRIARRGITYDDVGRNGDLTWHPDQGVGLLFLCFQSDIVNQFEFMQTFWANNNDFPKPFTGIDPVIGQYKNREDSSGLDAEQKWRDIKGDQHCSSLSHFVNMKGGEYFFAPSIKFFKNLKTTK
ncbi:Dyp-type peroxidase [Ekhidna sp. MALMAid0563]|uniref:Dyp-type peroxidase n=1 Tax=Ekhidna sp. MALMAid0563 TaxID=3143937 RepID=UPI0032DF9433